MDFESLSMRALQLDPLGGVISDEPDKPRGSRYQIIKDLGPKSHNNHGLEALIPQ